MSDKLTTKLAEAVATMRFPVGVVATFGVVERVEVTGDGEDKAESIRTLEQSGWSINENASFMNPEGGTEFRIVALRTVEDVAVARRGPRC